MKNRKRIIIAIIVIVTFLLCMLLIYLYNNTPIFKSSKEIQSDLTGIQDEIKNNTNEEVEKGMYSDYVGVSGETLYIKENTDSKIKEAIKNTDIGYEKKSTSNNGLLVIDTYKDTEAIECKVISSTKEQINLTAYGASNLCEGSYSIGSIDDKKTVEEGTDNLVYTVVAPNTTYTISNIFEKGTNTMFFFDSNKKFISSTSENTFKTPSNANYMKVISNFENEEELKNTEIRYCMVLGTESGNNYEVQKTEIGIDANSDSPEVYFPIEADKLVIYIDGGDIELKYVSK